MEELVIEMEVMVGEGNVAEGKVIALVVCIQELDLAVSQHMLHPLVSLILSTRTQIIFALYVMLVHIFQLGIKLVLLIFLSCSLMIVLWIENCGARTHTLTQKKRQQKKKYDTSSS